jgi:hypothetical protein
VAIGLTVAVALAAIACLVLSRGVFENVPKSAFHPGLTALYAVLAGATLFFALTLIYGKKLLVVKPEDFFRAAEEGRVTDLQDILKRVDANTKDASENTVLHTICLTHRATGVGRDADTLRANLETCFTLVLQNGGDVNIQNADRDTPLHLAAQHQLLPIVNAILTRNPDLALNNNNGETAWDVVKSRPVNADTRDAQAGIVAAFKRKWPHLS